MNSIAEAIYANSVIPIPEVRPDIKITYVVRGIGHEAQMEIIRARIKMEEEAYKEAYKEFKQEKVKEKEKAEKGTISKKSKRKARRAYKRAKRKEKNERNTRDNKGD